MFQNNLPILKGKKILGIDLGIALMGFGLITWNNLYPSYVTHGYISTCKLKPKYKRLEDIYTQLTEILNIFTPDLVIVERVFHTSNTKTINTINQVHGIVYLVLAKLNIKFIEFTPMQIKKSIFIKGKHNKKDIISRVKSILHIKKSKREVDDAFDALASTLCFAFRSYYNENGCSEV